jgi:hypothetical protein
MQLVTRVPRKGFSCVNPSRWTQVHAIFPREESDVPRQRTYLLIDNSICFALTDYGSWGFDRTNTSQVSEDRMVMLVMSLV